MGATHLLGTRLQARAACLHSWYPEMPWAWHGALEPGVIEPAPSQQLCEPDCGAKNVMPRDVHVRAGSTLHFWLDGCKATTKRASFTVSCGPIRRFGEFGARLWTRSA